MELSVEQERRLAALRNRRHATGAPAAMVVSTLDIRAPESTRLMISAMAFLAVSAGVVGLRSTTGPAADMAAPTAAERATQPRPTAGFTLAPLIPATVATSTIELASGPRLDPTTTDVTIVDSITQAT